MIFTYEYMDMPSKAPCCDMTRAVGSLLISRYTLYILHETFLNRRLPKTDYNMPA